MKRIKIIALAAALPAVLCMSGTATELNEQVVEQLVQQIRLGMAPGIGKRPILLASEQGAGLALPEAGPAYVRVEFNIQFGPTHAQIRERLERQFPGEYGFHWDGREPVEIQTPYSRYYRTFRAYGTMDASEIPAMRKDPSNNVYGVTLVLRPF